jgi:peptide/nickel transport system substrate-binding protein
VLSIGSLDPAKANAGTDPTFLDPIYAPLFRVTPDGQYAGVLASSWQYVPGSSNKVFQLTVRSGVQFSDGEPVNAAAVVGSIKHYEAGSDGQSWLAGCGNVTALSAMQVQITCAKPNPEIPAVLSDQIIGGDIVAPASLAKPATLATDPIGAGPYVLDTAATIAGATYTYTANPKYFDQSAIHWNQIVVKFYANSTTALAALRSGQLQFAFLGDPTAMQTAQGQGLNVQGNPAVFLGVGLFNRAATGGNPIGNLKVRQALEYAVDRPAIVKALFGAFGQATQQVAVPGQDSAWNAAVNDHYPYDPAKAKQLLTQAGYPNGFSIAVEDQPIDAEITQAVAADWAKIGVKATITEDATTPAWINNVLAKKYSVTGYAYGGLPMFMEAPNWFLPVANPFNPFASSDPTMTSLLTRAATESGTAQTTDFQQVQAEGVQQAWYVGVAVQDAAVVIGSSVHAPGPHGLYLGNELDVTSAS